ncbi:hypothetical protein [Phaeodactylibacter xiamenensis]|uniref:hypothetical protein n=1 Tax=Phaeodactylibacter xiamenensis TaxID=1524460 RepID=UPI0024A99AA0|nr:hypothetical protein [Phaeodactylibacter xiamenensis]
MTSYLPDMLRQAGRHTCADNYRYIPASGEHPNLSVPSIDDGSGLNGDLNNHLG